MKPYSLLWRIGIGLTITMLIASLCAFGWLYLKAKWTDTALRERSLLDQAQVIASYLKVSPGGSVDLEMPPRLAEAYTSPDSPYRYAIRDADGQFLFDGSRAVRPQPVFDTRDQKVYDYDPDGAGPLHVFGAAIQTTVDGHTYIVQVEQQARAPAYLRKAVFDEFLADGEWLQFLFLFVLLGVSLWIVRRAIAPLQRVSKLAESIGPANAGLRLPLNDVPREVLPLVRSMNAALDRLEYGLQQQREFNANAAHQLRTPLAVLMANVGMLTEEQTANRLRGDVEHMSRIVSQLLLAAQLETLSIDINDIVDLNEAVAKIAASLAPLAIAAGKSIELTRNPSPVVVRSNSFALHAALGNVIENAIKHTPEGTSVRLRVTDGPTIEVMDSGPGIPRDRRDVVFERFWRGDRAKGGAGLGLAIVKGIMTALHGTVLIADAPTGGAIFTLVLPASAKVTSAPAAPPALALQ